jgi:hypothetical protein
MTRLTTLLLPALLLAPGPLTALGPAPGHPAPADAVAARPAAVDHAAFDRLLKKHVNAQGLVNYVGFKADAKVFNQYLTQLSTNPPAPSWSQAEQMAYWINAYNAYTIRLVLDHYPVQSIKDIGSKIQIPLVNTPWAAKFFSIGGEKMSLDHVEHDILRKQYNDPRVHFALVCASLSCPRLRPEAYTAARLNQQLDEQGRDFLNNPAKNQVGKTQARLSRYFDWYRSDWEQNGQSVAKWVNRYAATKMDANAPISYLDYNWSLNKQ